MMDNLQFRAWDAESQRMVNIARFDFADYTVYSHLFACDGYLGENLEIMQSTGFYDRYKEVPVYESDFVEIRTVRGDYYDSGIVKKKKGFLYIETKNKSIMLLSDFYFEGYTDNLELHVVGNIYEIKEELS